LAVPGVTSGLLRSFIRYLYSSQDPGDFYPLFQLLFILSLLEILLLKILSSILYSAALLSLANAHGVILAAQGEAGSPPSVGFQGTKFPAYGEVEQLLTIFQSIPPLRETAQVSDLANRTPPSFVTPKFLRTL
jgi:hypothetical protein